MREATPWPRWLALAQAFGVSPAAFWRLSLKEWRALAAPRAETLTRTAFEDLAMRFPDKQR